MVVVLALSLIPVAVVPRVQSTRPMFTDIAPPSMADSSAVSDGACFSDIYGDGREDLFVTNMSGPSHLWRNDGDGHFTDVTATSGITVANATSCAFVDFDGDGLPDLYVTSRSRATASQNTDEESKLFRNDGGGHFTDATATAGVGLPGRRVLSSDWADFNGHGLYGGYVPARSGPPPTRANALFEPIAPFKFIDIAHAKGLDKRKDVPTSIFLGSWFDYNGDGRPDLLLAVDFWGVELYRNDGGTFTRVTATAFHQLANSTRGAPPTNAMGVTWGDYDNDGCIDVFITGFNTYGQAGFGADRLGDLASRLYHNNCDGTFTDVTKEVGLRPTGEMEWSANFVDFDNDGDLDLAVVAGNSGKDTTRPTLGLAFAKRAATIGVSALKLFISAPLAAWLYRYEAMVPALGEKGIAAAMPLHLYRNLLAETGTARFVDVTDQLAVANMGSTQGSAWADIDNSGRLSWFVPGKGTPSRLFRNNGPAGHYLRVHVVGSKLRDAVGAWVKIKTGKGWQVRHVHVLDGFASQSQMDPHFGLGSATMVDELWVRWPGLTTWERLCTEVPADRKVTVIQGRPGCL